MMKRLVRRISFMEAHITETVILQQKCLEAANMLNRSRQAHVHTLMTKQYGAFESVFLAFLQQAMTQYVEVRQGNKFVASNIQDLHSFTNHNAEMRKFTAQMRLRQSLKQ